MSDNNKWLSAPRLVRLGNCGRAGAGSREIKKRKMERGIWPVSGIAAEVLLTRFLTDSACTAHLFTA